MLRAGGVEATTDALFVVSTQRATTVALAPAGAPRVGTVEHLFAALAGLGVHEGLAIEVEGPELPLLDGASARWVAAIEKLGIAPTPPPTRITRAGTVLAGSSRYDLSPGPTSVIEVSIEFDDARLGGGARWGGAVADFREHIAPARTFAFARDVEELASLGLARHVEPSSVVLVTPDAIHCAGQPFAGDEPARHKVLDLMGDLYLFGGPPLGTVRVVRPGHTANAHAFREARAAGLFAVR